VPFWDFYIRNIIFQSAQKGKLMASLCFIMFSYEILLKWPKHKTLQTALGSNGPRKERRVSYVSSWPLRLNLWKRARLSRKKNLRQRARLPRRRKWLLLPLPRSSTRSRKLAEAHCPGCKLRLILLWPVSNLLDCLKWGFFVVFGCFGPGTRRFWSGSRRFWG
jgi:hypothetical protein